MAEAKQGSQSQQQAVTGEVNEFEALLGKTFKPTTDAARDAIKAGVQTLAEQALANTALVSDDAVKAIQAMIAELDRKLTEQVNAVIHHPDFQALEGTWRGLHHLVARTETDEMLQIKVLNITKREIARTLEKFPESRWDQSPLFKKIYEDGYGQAGAAPFGCLIGDFYFNQTAPDVKVLQGMSKIAAAAHTPFIAAADPSVMNMQSWQELGDKSDITKIFSTPEYAAWSALRESDDSKYIGLTMPRFLSRMPYSIKNNPVDEFNFEEEVEGADPSKFVWANAAYAMGARITDAFKMYGWCARIRGVESGGMVDDLPVHTFPTDDGGTDMACPTEIAITDRREAELAKNGFMPLLHWKGKNYAVFVGAQSLHAPAAYTDPDATANAKLGSRLPYMFAICRFAHYLKCIVRDKIGSFKERDDMQAWLNQWILQYVEPDPSASEEAKARRPLAAAEVEVEADPENPGYYKAKFALRPHYQLEGLTVSLRLVAKLPSAKKA